MRGTTARWLLAGLLAGGCTEKVLDASGGVGVGAPCEPDDPGCGGGLVCEPLSAGTGEHMCASAVEIHGRVIDALDEQPIADAWVVAVDELGAATTTSVRTDADGRYVLPVSLARDEDGEVVESRRWTMQATAAGHLVFPGPLRPSMPVGSEAEQGGIIETAATTISLVPASRSGVMLSGRVEGDEPAGTLVIAEGPTPAPLGFVDADGRFALFDVPPGRVEVRGYRFGVELQPVVIDVGDEDVDEIELELLTDDPAQMGVVRGSVVLVDAPGGAVTSVVLVPTAVYGAELERGPVPGGLRDPSPPQAPDVTSGFEITGVPAGRYTVLAGLENDGVVREPDVTLAGTQEVEVARGQVVELGEGLRLTGALEVVGPGADAPEVVDGSPVLVWADDASEDRYEVVVYDARGDVVWHDDAIERVTGVAVVEVPYGGPPLTSGMSYQFRATAWRDAGGEPTAISRTEDLRGIFVAR